VEDNKHETGLAHLRPGEGRSSLWVMGEMVTCKVTSDQTSGAYSLFEIATQPGDGPRLTSSIGKTNPSTCSKGSTSFWTKTAP
jgi:hypothetical protein